MFSILGTSTSSSDTATVGGLFYGVLILSFGLIGALLVFSKKDVIKHIGEGLTLAFFAALIYLSKFVSELNNTVSDSDYFTIGSIYALLITAIVFGFLFLILSVVMNYFLSSISELLKNVKKNKAPEKTLEEKLTEIEMLRSKDLISEE